MSHWPKKVTWPHPGSCGRGNIIEWGSRNVVHWWSPCDSLPTVYNPEPLNSTKEISLYLAFFIYRVKELKSMPLAVSFPISLPIMKKSQWKWTWKSWLKKMKLHFKYYNINTIFIKILYIIYKVYISEYKYKVYLGPKNQPGKFMKRSDLAIVHEQKA